jgi:hypothetical protein
MRTTRHVLYLIGVHYGSCLILNNHFINNSDHPIDKSTKVHAWFGFYNYHLFIHSIVPSQIIHCFYEVFRFHEGFYVSNVVIQPGWGLPATRAPTLWIRMVGIMCKCIKTMNWRWAWATNYWSFFPRMLYQVYCCSPIRYWCYWLKHGIIYGWWNNIT